MAADAQVQYAFLCTVNVLAELVSELLAISDTVTFFVFILGWHATEDSKTSVHVFAGRAVKRLLESQHVLGINSQDIHRTPQGPYAEEKISSQLDISS